MVNYFSFQLYRVETVTLTTYTLVILRELSHVSPPTSLTISFYLT